MQNNNTTSQNVSISSDQTEDSCIRWANKEYIKYENGDVGTDLKQQSSTLESRFPPISSKMVTEELSPISNKPDSKKKKKKSKKHHGSAELINGSVNSNKTVSDVKIYMDNNINNNKQYNTNM